MFDLSDCLFGLVKAYLKLDKAVSRHGGNQSWSLVSYFSFVDSVSC